MRGLLIVFIALFLTFKFAPVIVFADEQTSEIVLDETTSGGEDVVSETTSVEESLNTICIFLVIIIGYFIEQMLKGAFKF